MGLVLLERYSCERRLLTIYLRLVDVFLIFCANYELLIWSKLADFV
jgi:hypothetical protein